jgi:hypothetical protein
VTVTCCSLLSTRRCETMAPSAVGAGGDVAPVGAIMSFLSGVFDSINIVTPVQCIYGSEVCASLSQSLQSRRALHCSLRPSTSLRWFSSSLLTLPPPFQAPRTPPFPPVRKHIRIARDLLEMAVPCEMCDSWLGC